MILRDLLSTLKTSYIGACCRPQEAVVCSSATWLDQPAPWGERCVKKFSNLLCLTECGFYGHLEEDGLFYLNMDVYCRPRRYPPLTFSKLSRLQNETDKKQGRSLIFAAMNMYSKRCLFVLHGRPHPARSSRVCESQGPGGFKGPKS